MARREANLAGLAALGALGYKLATSGKGRDTSSAMARAAEPDVPMEMGDDQYNPDVKQYMDDTINEDVKQRKPAGRKTSAPSSPAMMTKEEEAKIRATGGPRGTRYLPKNEPDMSAYKPRRSPDQIGAPRQVMGQQPARQMTREERIASIPGSSPEGWTGGTGERINSTELGRNASNIMNATAGLSVPGYVGKMTQAGYNARAASRRANEGLSDLEAADLLRRRALSEADTTGGAVGYKKGGAAKVKKKASGGMTKKAEKPAAKGWGQARGARGAKYY